MNFKLGSTFVFLVSSTTFTQSFKKVTGGRTRRRTQNGGLKTTQHWNKLSIDTSGSGHIPHGLSGLDYSQNLLLSAGSTRSIFSTSTVIALPAGRRSDVGYEPCAFALFNDKAIETTINIVGDIATLGGVSGASGYSVAYYPELIVAAEEPVESFDGANGVWNWSLLAEEV